MKNNVNFREQLIIPYLGLLAENDNVEEFKKYYLSAEQYLTSYVKEINDLEKLNVLKSVISYAEKNMKMTVQR